MIYAMDIGIVAQVSATRPVLVGDYDSIQEINRQIEQYYQKPGMNGRNRLSAIKMMK